MLAREVVVRQQLRLMGSIPLVKSTGAGLPSCAIGRPLGS
jgi:hypothetical protein